MLPSSGSKRWTVAYRQWQGARPYQEDDFAILEAGFAGQEASPGLLMVLADGMGGEAGGAQASRGVVRSFLHLFSVSDGPVGIRFERCLEGASGNLRELVKENPELEGMGSTVVSAHYDGEELTWLSVGDSPMWLFSVDRLERLNADHSMAQVLDRLVESGELTEEEARNDRGRHMLLSAVTGEQVELVDCAKRSCQLSSRDCLLIASDGIQTLSDEEIERHLAEGKGNAELTADALLTAVHAASGPTQDNVTFLLLFGEDCVNDTTMQPTDSEDVIESAGYFRTFRRWFTSPFCKGLGLGLSIGFLVTAISLWWPDRSPNQESASNHGVVRDRLTQSVGESAGQNSESVELDVVPGEGERRSSSGTSDEI